MTADIEHDLRQLFAADAAHAPVPHDLANGARRSAHQQVKRQRRVAVLACAGVAAVLVGGIAVLQRPTTDHSAPAATGGPDASAAVSSPSPPSSFGPVVPETPALYFHNVEVPVPAAMLTAPLNCGKPDQDAAYVLGFDAGGCPGGAVPAAPTVTTVVLQPWKARAGIPAPKTGTHVLADGRTQMVTAIPSTDLRFIVTSPDPKRADRLFGGLRIITMAHGCPVRDTEDAHELPPFTDGGTPEGGSACAYQGGWLVGSSWMDATQSQDVATLSAEPVGSYAACPSPTGLRPVDDWRVHLRFPTGDRLLYVPFEACNATPLTERLWELAKPPLVSLRS